MAFAIVAVVALHVLALHVSGPNNPGGRPVPAKESVPFHPYYTTKDLSGLVLFALVFVALAFLWPDLLSEPENYRPANPMHTPADIEPEWYFLPFYGLLQSVPSKFGGLLAAAGSILILFVVPWLDRSPIRSARERPACRMGMAGLVIAFVLMGLVGRHHAEGAG